MYVPPGTNPPKGAKPAIKNLDDVFDSPIWYVAQKKVPAHAMPQISAHVTSLARVKLWHLMNEAEKRGGRVHYTDTDSITVSGATMPTSSELGALKDETPNGIEGDFLRAKVYRIHGPGIDRIKWKGLRRDQRTAENFERGKRGEKVENPRFEKFRTIARDGLRAPRMNEGNTLRIVSPYDKREMLADGSTRPLVLNEPRELLQKADGTWEWRLQKLTKAKDKTRRAPDELQAAE